MLRALRNYHMSASTVRVKQNRLLVVGGFRGYFQKRLKLVEEVHILAREFTTVAFNQVNIDVNMPKAPYSEL